MERGCNILTQGIMTVGLSSRRSPTIGAFISPDMIVPRPVGTRGLVIDYNRYAYARGNPLKFTDPTGHCVVNSDGSRAESDVDCWRFVDAIGSSWDQNSGWWENTFSGYDKDSWMATFAPHSAFDQAWMGTVLNMYLGSSSYQSAVYGPQFEAHPTPEYAPVNIPNPCNFWDCPAIGLDLASLGTSIAQTGAAACTATGVGAPVCGPATAYLTYVDFGLNATSILYEGNKFIQGDSTTMDLSVTLADGAVKPFAEALGAGASATPGVGVAYDALMLGYDVFIDPFVHTSGQAKIAR